MEKIKDNRRIYKQSYVYLKRLDNNTKDYQTKVTRKWRDVIVKFKLECEST